MGIGDWEEKQEERRGREDHAEVQRGGERLVGVVAVGFGEEEVFPVDFSGDDVVL